jgi:SpoVK/Ycf46/Vps4 family AAA+-type ATPase
MLAKYLSGRFGVPAIEVRISSLMSQWLGETEKLFKRLTDVLDAMAPVIVYMDEIEKMFSEEGGGSSGSASMVRATGHLLSWMNDTTAPVFIIATANNVARMGEIGLTMTRRGRFDALFYIGYPGVDSRKTLFDRYAGRGTLRDDLVQKLAAETKYFTGADISGVVQDAKSMSGGSITLETLQSAIVAHRSRVEAMQQMYVRSTGGIMSRLAIPAGDFERENPGGA